MLATSALLLAESALSCTREEFNDSPLGGVPVSLRIEDIKTGGTKSVLTDPDIETKVTNVTLAAYSLSDDSLIESAYFSGGSGMRLELGGQTQARIYALVNMGDLRTSLPENVSGLSGLTYDIPAYTGSPDSINEAGLPMAGSLDYDADRPAGTDIPVRRLVAKIAVDLNVHWEGAVSSVRIRNMNRHLSPFGESRARSSADTFDEEVEAGGGVRQGSFVFYVPENEQGTVPEITASSGKSGDNAALSALKERLTFLEVKVAGEEKYNGELTYRSYLGKNATSDFSITRNKRYTWKVDYFRDGTFLDDWKHENGLSWSDFRYQVYTPENSAYIGDDLLVYLQKAEDKYENGKLKRQGSFQHTDTRLAEWTNEAWTPANFLVFKEVGDHPGFSFRRYVAMREGDGYVKASIEADEGTFTDRVWLSCLGPEPILALAVQPASIQLGETVQLSLTLDGRDIMGDDFTSFLLLKGRFGISTSDGHDLISDHYYHIIGQDGKWTPTETGTYEMYASFNGPWLPKNIRSNTVSFTVTEADVPSTTYTLTIEPSNPEPKMVGETVGLQAWLNTFVDGLQTGHEDITGSVMWNCPDAEVNADGGQVSSTREGTFSVQAEYDVPDGERLSASVNVSFTGDPNYITLSASPATITVGETATATVLFNGSSTVTGSAAIKAYAEESGNAGTDIVSVSGAVITGLSEGECWIGATYTTGGKTYVSGRTKIKVNAVVVPPPVADPLVIAWAQEPAYVAQRGLITVSGLSEGETVRSFQATSGADKLRLEPAGATCYAGLLKAGAFTVTVTTSAGRTASLSGTASAPTLQSGTTALYANPDGSPARDGQDGLSGNPLTWRYQGGGTALSVTTAETATGTQLYAPLYDELLSPAFSVSSDRLHLGSDVSELYVTSLEGYPSAGGTELGVLTLKPRNSSSGVAEKQVRILSVDPFSEWTAPVSSETDLEDWSLLDGYCAIPSDYANGTVTTHTIHATKALCGLAVFIGDTEADSDFKALFHGSVFGDSIHWNIGQDNMGSLSKHPAGEVSLQATVTNRHSGERLFRPFAAFRLTVHGAVGAEARLMGKTTEGRYRYMQVQARLIGNTDGTPFAEGLFKIGSTIERNTAFAHSLGSHPYIVTNTAEMQVAEYDNDGYVLEVYPAELNGGTYRPSSSVLVESDILSFKQTTESDLKWGVIISPGRVVTEGKVLRIDSHYVLHLLEDVQTQNLINGNKGWIH